jgi:transcription elongation factor Elf1
MTKNFLKPEVTGTRTGYVIRFTCPACSAENVIVNKTPRDHFKEARDASCTKCRKRSSVLTPYAVPQPVRVRAPALVECQPVK